MESMDTELQSNHVEKSLSIVVQLPESTHALSWTGEQEGYQSNLNMKEINQRKKGSGPHLQEYICYMDQSFYPPTRPKSSLFLNTSREKA